jgi:nucleoside-diphosphate-sugar epimerase
MSDSIGTARRAVIFGGAGFIGRHIAAYLLANQMVAEVVLADLERPIWQLPEGVSYVSCDVRETIEGLPAPDLIVNLAAVHRTPGHADAEYHETNETGAAEVLRFAEQHDVKRIWFTSSIAVYGPGEETKTEQSVPAPVSAYGKSKLNAERAHESWAKSKPGRKLVVARPATVFGPGEGGNFTRLASAMKRHLFFYPGRRDTRKACGYVNDLGPSFAFMEQFATPAVTYNFAYPEPPTIEDVCLAFAAAGLPRPRIRVPAPLLLGAGGVLKRIGISAVDPERIQKLMVSTDVRGELLASSGYRWQSDLRSGIADWRDRPPSGEFV